MSAMTDTIKLSQARRGDRGVIVQVGTHCHHQDHEIELERRLLELGFVEGARVELLHEAELGIAHTQLGQALRFPLESRGDGLRQINRVRWQVGGGESKEIPGEVTQL